MKRSDTTASEPDRPGRKATAVARSEDRHDADTAAYIADLAGELALLARGAKLEMLAYFLMMARTEAEASARSAARGSDP